MVLLQKFNINLVAGLYQVAINYPYQVFVLLTNTELFNEVTYKEFSDKIYIILGVVVLFLMAYSLLNVIIDPDKNKGGKEIWNFIKNILKTFVILAILPFIFQFSVQVQNSIVDNDVIGQFFGGDTENAETYEYCPEAANENGEDDNSIRYAGRKMAATTFQTFFTVADGGDSDPESKDTAKYKCSSDSEPKEEKLTLSAANSIANETGKLNIYCAFAENIKAGDIDFNWFAALIAGLYLGYCIISFCFDVALRACKLLFYKIIAPLCVACRIIPKWEDIYKKWMKNIIDTYLSLFQRIIILSFGCYLLNTFFKSNLFAPMEGDRAFGVGLLARLFVILGIVTFIKQAPKLLDEITGIGKGVKFGIKDKFKEGITPPTPMLAAASAIGAGVTSGVQNFSKRRQKIRELKDLKNKGVLSPDDYKKRVRIARLSNSTMLGAASGLIRGANQGKGAKDWKSMVAAAGKGAQNQAAAADKHTNYMADHGGTLGGAIRGHFSDIKGSITDWMKGKDVPTLERQSAALGKFTSNMSKNKSDAEGIVSSEMAKGKNSKLSFEDLLKSYWSDYNDGKIDEARKTENYMREVLSLTGHTMNMNGEIFDKTGKKIDIKNEKEFAGTIFGMQKAYVDAQRTLEDLQRRFNSGDRSVTAETIQSAKDAVAGKLKTETDKLQSVSFADAFMDDKSDMFVDTFKSIGLSGKETVGSGISIAGTISATKGSTLESLERLKNGKGTMADFKNGVESMKNSSSADKARIDNEIAVRKKEEAAKGDKK